MLRTVAMSQTTLPREMDFLVCEGTNPFFAQNPDPGAVVLADMVSSANGNVIFAEVFASDWF